jgi:hypothetical protein
MLKDWRLEQIAGAMVFGLPGTDKFERIAGAVAIVSKRSS